MKNYLINLWHDERGAETAEWLIVVALIATVAAFIYADVLQAALQQAITYIEGIITGIGGTA